MDAALVMVSVPSEETARAMARALVEARLAAGVNVAAGIASAYRWQGAVEERAEALLFAKTRADLVAPLIDFVKARHPDGCPAILALPVAGGNPAYLAWIETETAAPATTA